MMIDVSVSRSSLRESLLAEMGVSIKEDGGTLGVFSPKGVSVYLTFLSLSGLVYFKFRIV